MPVFCSLQAAFRTTIVVRLRVFIFLFFPFIGILAVPFAALGNQPGPGAVVAEDKRNDGGAAIVVRWDKVIGEVARYEVVRVAPDGSRHVVGTVGAEDTTLVDKGSKKAPVKDGVSYRYMVRVVYGDGVSVPSAMSEAVRSEPSWLNTGRLCNMAAVALFAGMFFVLFLRGRKGRLPYIRPIPGFNALEDAVGRAAEMGKPILYVPGLQDASNPATVASMSLLSEVVKRAARLRTRVKVPNYSSITWPVAQNVTKEAYMKAGRPEDYDPDDVAYLTSRQFTFTAAVIGMMARLKTASNFLIGHFYSESLILAETGAETGAVQIGGTDSETQLPFLITTCDYMLIGEELFAAAALATDDPVSRSTIAAHDWFKILVMVLIGAGFVLSLLGALEVPHADDLAQTLGKALVEDRE